MKKLLKKLETKWFVKIQKQKFLKNCMCKHVVCIGIRLKYCQPSLAAKTVPIGEKRKKGRPNKVKPALLVQ